MNKLKEQLRLRMLGQLSDEKTNIDINNAYSVAVDFSLSVLSFLRENNISKEKMEDDLSMEIDLSSQYDYRLSEMCKIKNYMILYKEAED